MGDGERERAHDRNDTSKVGLPSSALFSPERTPFQRRLGPNNSEAFEVRPTHGRSCAESMHLSGSFF